MEQIAIIGAGSWGTALGIVAARAGARVYLWSRDAERAATMNRERVNRRHLAGHVLPDGVTVTANLSETLGKARMVVLAAPSQATRSLLREMRADMSRDVFVVSASKGIEAGTGKRISEIVGEELAGEFVKGFVALSGPSFAEEVASNQPTAIVAASENQEASAATQRLFSYGNLRVYTNGDVTGTELGGAVKNVMALAAGMCAGLNLGTNSVAALITRGLAEISRFALAQGARGETLMGLAGLGDLVLTCTGSLSRNRYVGEQLGRGYTLDKILAGMHETAEGVSTTAAVRTLADRCHIEMPITAEVYRVLYEGKSVGTAIEELMSRPLRDEYEGS